MPKFELCRWFASKIGTKISGKPGGIHREKMAPRSEYSGSSMTRLAPRFELGRGFACTIGTKVSVKPGGVNGENGILPKSDLCGFSMARLVSMFALSRGFVVFMCVFFYKRACAIVRVVARNRNVAAATG